MKHKLHLVTSKKQSTLDERKKLLKNNPTESEIRIKNLLKEIGIRAMFQKGFIAGENFCIVDFYIPKYQICIEVDGGYHYTPEQIKRDQNRDWYLVEQRNCTVIHIKNEMANIISGEKLLSIIHNHNYRGRATYLPPV